MPGISVEAPSLIQVELLPLPHLKNNFHVSKSFLRTQNVHYNLEHTNPHLSSLDPRARLRRHYNCISIVLVVAKTVDDVVFVTFLGPNYLPYYLPIWCALSVLIHFYVISCLVLYLGL
jgi:hypothetical protein